MLNVEYFKDYENEREVIITKATRTIKIKTPLTGEGNEFKIYGFMSYLGSETVYVLFEKAEDIFHHPNLYLENKKKITLANSRLTLHRIVFCNAINKLPNFEGLDSNPVVYTIMFQKELETPNYSHAFDYTFFEKSVDLKKKDFAIRCRSCGNIIKNTNSYQEILTRYCAACLTLDKMSNLKQILNNEENSNKVFVKKTFSDSYSMRDKITDIPASNRSSYYKPIKFKDVNIVDLKMPKTELDIIALGLGSAGTNILAQIARTNYFRKYMIVDFDTVEEKNLRNQFYVTNTVGFSKVCATGSILRNLTLLDINIIEKNDYFQNAELENYKAKYIILGFDSIKTRMEAFNKIKEGEYEAEYIIDTRYDNLDASIYFIDVNNVEQMKHYESSLKRDAAALESPVFMKEKYSLDFIIEMFKTEAFICSEKMCKVLNESEYNVFCNKVEKITGMKSFCNMSSLDCHREKCLKNAYKILNYYEYEADKIPHKEIDDYLNKHFAPVETENTCLAMNIIDIYTYASSYVTSTIREIEEGREKQMTHVEVTTDKLPNGIVVKK